MIKVALLSNNKEIEVKESSIIKIMPYLVGYGDVLGSILTLDDGREFIIKKEPSEVVGMIEDIKSSYYTESCSLDTEDD